VKSSENDNRARWAVVGPILDAALELPPEQRNDLLQRECGDDTGLRREIEDILRAGERDAGFLDTPAAAFAATLIAAESSDGDGSQPLGINVG